MSRRSGNRGFLADWRPKPARVHRGGAWSRANRRKAEAERRRRVGRAITFVVGIPLALALAGALVFGERGLWRVAGMSDHQRQLLRDIAAIEARNAALRTDITRLRSDPFTIEAIARERLGMGRKGDVVYYFQPPEQAEAR
ncbi:MAG: FtsB family cell division protein [Nitrospirota bacterium]